MSAFAHPPLRRRKQRGALQEKIKEKWRRKDNYIMVAGPVYRRPTAALRKALRAHGQFDASVGVHSPSQSLRVGYRHVGNPTTSQNGKRCCGLLPHVNI